jgi:ferredoxin
VSESGPGLLSVSVRAEQCAASGGCRAAAPEVFGQTSEGWVVLLDAHPPAGLTDDVLDAQDACPMGVIEVTHGG